MAVASGSHPLNFGNIGCGFRPSSGTLRAYIDSVTSNGLQSNGKIEYVVKVSGSASINNLVWSSASGTQSWSFSCGGQTQSATTSKQCQSTGNCAGGGCCCCICNGITYNPGQKTFTLQLSPSTTTITLNVKWNTNGPATATYTIPESMRVTPPSGLSVSWPSSLSGSTASSVSSWGGATPGCYTLQLLSPTGSSLDSTTSCTSSTSTQYQDTPGSYSANSRYRLKVTACNHADMCVSDTSSYYYTSPPTPSVYIDSLLYDPNSQKCVCNWSWSKPSDGGYYDETITYDVYDQEGNYYVRGGALGTATGGVAKSGSQTTTNILTAVNLCVKVYVSTSAGVSSATACAYAPVAGAAFLGFDWDELRRTCTVRATAPGARQTRVSGGYAPNVYSIGSKVTPGEFGDLVVKDLDHGAGEILYLEAMPEATDNHQYIDEVAKISIPIPNPILGVLTPSCEQIAAGEEKKYIVDIIEKKKNSSTCTPRWQNGDRVVVKEKCPGGGLIGDYSSTGKPCDPPYGGNDTCLSHYQMSGGVFSILPGRINEDSKYHSWSRTNIIPCVADSRLMGLPLCSNWKIEVSPSGWLDHDYSGIAVAASFMLFSRDGRNLVTQLFGPVYDYGYGSALSKRVSPQDIGGIAFNFSLWSDTVVTTPVEFRLRLY